jgi:hypothetical protein
VTLSWAGDVAERLGPVYGVIGVVGRGVVRGLRWREGDISRDDLNDFLSVGSGEAAPTLPPRPPSLALPLKGGEDRTGSEEVARWVLERCPLGLKEELEVWGKEVASVGVMRRVKAKLDPKGILNPGRFVGGI